VRGGGGALWIFSASEGLRLGSACPRGGVAPLPEPLVGPGLPTFRGPRAAEKGADERDGGPVNIPFVSLSSASWMRAAAGLHSQSPKTRDLRELQV